MDAYLQLQESAAEACAFNSCFVMPPPCPLLLYCSQIWHKL